MKKMLITEYRIPLPLTVEEYERGKLFTCMEINKKETGGGEGVQILQNKPFIDPTSKHYRSGQYTYKIYHASQKIPTFLRNLAPQGKLEIHQESKDCFPFCKTQKRVTFLDDGFFLDILTYVDTIANGENVYNLPYNLLKKRNVVYMDIVNDPCPDQSEYNLAKLKSAKTGRGPFLGNWIQTSVPLITCYKLVTVDFKWFGLQTRVEKLCQSTERRIFYLFYKTLLGSLDKWIDLTIDEIRQIEIEGAIELNKMRFEGNVKGLIIKE